MWLPAGWTALVHVLLPLTSDRKGQELLMARFLGCVLRCFLAWRCAQSTPFAPGPRTHRSVAATGEMRGNGPADCAKSSVPVATVLLAGMLGNGAAVPAAGPTRPACPRENSTLGLGSATQQWPQIWSSFQRLCPPAAFPGSWLGQLLSIYSQSTQTPP